MAKPTKIKKYNPRNTGITTNVFGNRYAPTQLSYSILEGLYENTILKKIIKKYIANIVPIYFTLTIEDENEERLPELEKECKQLSSILNRKLYRQMWKSYFLYGTAILYDGNRDEDDIPKEILVLHPRDIEVELYPPESNKYGEIKHWVYNYGGYEYKINPEHIKVFSNDPPIGEIFGNSIVNPMLDTLHQFLNNRLDLAEILNRYAIPIVQWAVDVSDIPDEQSQDNLIDRAWQMLQEQLGAGDDFISDARVEARTLSFANDVGHLISILQESRRDLGMLSIPESLMGGEISNLSGGKTQAAVFMTEIADYRGEQNDFISEEWFIPFLEKKGKIRGKDFHNIYIAFPPATTELPSESIIWLKTAFELGWITSNEARAMLGFRGASPGITEEVKEAFLVRTIGNQNDGNPDNGHTVIGTKKSTEGDTKSKNNKKVDEPKNRDGRAPPEE